MKLNKNYWNNRYKKKETGWDVGYASTPLKNYIDQLENKRFASSFRMGNLMKLNIYTKRV